MPGKFSQFLLNDETHAEVDMTPMLDIVFIMLIFFIVSTSFVKETGISVDRPSAENSQSQHKTSLLVAINAEGQIWVDRKQIPMSALQPTLERLLVQTPNAGVVIQADHSAITGVLVSVMDQIRAAGIEKIAIATDKQ